MKGSQKHVSPTAIKRLTLAVTISACAGVQANTITVNGQNASDCTLVKAIKTANDGSSQPPCAAGDPSGSDVINLHGDQYLQAVDNTTDGKNGLPSVTSKITINGNGHKIARSSSASVFRIFHVAAGGDLTLDNVTVSDGIANGAGYYESQGGGIFNWGMVTLSNATVSNNSAITGGFREGGGIWNGGRLDVDRSVVSANFAGYFGGGIFNAPSSQVTIAASTISGNSTSGSGAGMYSQSSTVSLSNTTISGNTASSSGGGLANNSGKVSVVNSTISGNVAQSGGGLSNRSSTVVVTNTTIAENIATHLGSGAGLTRIGGTVTLRNTILFNSGGNDCGSLGDIVNESHNWLSDDSCVADGAGDPKLGPLTDNGGATKTHALLAGSGAIDAGDDAVCAAAPVGGKDQRGETRPKGAHCDIGAFEADVVVPPPDDTTFFVIPTKNGKTVVFGL